MALGNYSDSMPNTKHQNRKAFLYSLRSGDKPHIRARTTRCNNRILKSRIGVT